MRRDGQLPPPVRGVKFHGLGDLGEALDALIGARPVIDAQRAAKELAPRELAMVHGELKRFGRYVQLRRLSPDEDDFVRVYSGQDGVGGDRVIIYVYDLSASSASNPENLARREFEAVRRFQKSPALPSLVDSFQALPDFSGEVFFFSTVDSAATPLSEAEKDAGWTTASRLAFASSALRELASLQHPSGDGGALVHRSLSPETVRVRSDGRPLFAGWRWARLPKSETIADGKTAVSQDLFSAPEVRKGGLGAADVRSDVFSLCMALAGLFSGQAPEAEEARGILRQGLTDDPALRRCASELADDLALIAEVSTSAKPPESPQHWDEGALVQWNGDRFRVVSRLGEGAAGRTFKLEQLDEKTDETGLGNLHVSGLWVATVTRAELRGRRIDGMCPLGLNAYQEPGSEVLSRPEHRPSAWWRIARHTHEATHPVVIDLSGWSYDGEVVPRGRDVGCEHDDISCRILVAGRKGRQA